MLPPMRIRQYSISSTPLDDHTVASLTWSVLDKTLPGRKENFVGVASTFLSDLEEGDHIHVAVRPGRANFHPPEDIERTPTIMLCSGSGIAPFRGFIQERSIQVRQGKVLAAAYLFVGCANPDSDNLHRDELAQWEREGVVKVFWAFSRVKERSYGCRYVQDRLWRERAEVAEAYRMGARLYIFGRAAMCEGVTATAKEIYRISKSGSMPPTSEEVEAWLARLVSDFFD